MKRLASIILFIGVFLGISAQENTFRFGYLSYEGAIQSMPEYAIVQKKMKALQEQYQAETLRVEDEFNRKYEDFLDGQRDFPRTILQKPSLRSKAVRSWPMPSARRWHRSASV